MRRSIPEMARWSSEFRADGARADPCAATAAGIAAFVAGERGDAALREHCAGCAACRERYVEAVETIARIGRAARIGREARRRRGERIAFPVETARRRRLGLRLLALPVVIAIVGSRLGEGVAGPAHVAVRALEGEVRAGGRELVAAAVTELSRGAWCATGDGRAALEIGATALELAPGSRLLLEDPARPRFRLETGRLSARGPCVVATALGVLESAEGACVLTATSDGIEVECVEGVLSWIDPAGARDVPAGSSWRASPRPGGL